MKNIKAVLCTMLFVCLLSFSTIAEEPPPVCKDGHVPIGNKTCPNGFAPEQNSSTQDDTNNDLFTFDEFIEFIESLF